MGGIVANSDQTQSDQSQKLSISRITKLDTGKSATSIGPDDTQRSSHGPLTTSYVIQSQRQQRKRAVVIYFTPVKNRPEIAMTEMVLWNDADVPLLFKLCCDTTSRITAAPAGSGCIPPRAEQRCYLTWRRSREQRIQEETKTPRLILITNFVAQEIDNNQTMVTKLIARLHSQGEGAEEQIPIMKLTFERKEITSSAKTANSLIDQNTVQKTETDYREEAILKELNNLIQWLQRHPLETMMILLFITALFVSIFC